MVRPRITSIKDVRAVNSAGDKFPRRYMSTLNSSFSSSSFPPPPRISYFSANAAHDLYVHEADTVASTVSLHRSFVLFLD